MTRSVIFHSVFLLLSVAWAAHVWTYKPLVRGERPKLFAAQADELQRVEYRWATGQVVLKPLGPVEGRTYRVSFTGEFDRQAVAKPARVDPRTKQPVASPEPTVEAGPVPVVSETFPAGQFVAGVIKKLTPLHARRSLGEVDAVRLTEMGLDQPSRHLSVEAGGKILKLDIGGKTFGGQANYAREPGQSEVFLLDAEFVRTLEATPPQLMESRIVATPPADVLAMDVEIDGQLARFLHRNRSQFRQRHFVQRDQPTTTVDAASTFLTSLRTAHTKRWSEAGTPSGEALLTVRLQRDDQDPLDLRLFALLDGPGFLVESGPWFAELPAEVGGKLLEEARAVTRTD